MIGMLWSFDSPKSTLDYELGRAAVYYRQKYGRSPNLCFVHPSMIPEKPYPAGQVEMYAGEIEIRTTRSIQRNHLWLGVDDEVSPQASFAEVQRQQPERKGRISPALPSPASVERSATATGIKQAF